MIQIALLLHLPDVSMDLYSCVTTPAKNLEIEQFSPPKYLFCNSTFNTVCSLLIKSYFLMNLVPSKRTVKNRLN